ncbi:MAG: hypothetical protein HYU64_05480 [Armatimonadetes bacterium]|nr:hypothetical protein [Armatimonadota bacterium]
MFRPISGIIGTAQLSTTKSLPAFAKDLLEKKNGIISFSGGIAALTSGPIKPSGSLYVTLRKTDRLEVFLKEEPSSGYTYKPHYRKETFQLLEETLTQSGDSVLRKLLFQPRVSETEDYLPITFTLSSEKHPKPKGFLGMFVRVGDSPAMVE